MNKLVKYLFTGLATAFIICSCQEEPRDVPTTDVGPVMSNVTVSEAVYMGANIKFSADLSDKGFALSTLKAELFFDETLVSETVIRTKEYGKYEGNLYCPLLKDIPNGEATVILKAQNVGLGISSQEFSVAVSRPDFPNLTLVAGNQTYTMTKGEGYSYSVSGDFPASLNALIITPAVNPEGDVITLGWDGSALAADNDTEIPFSMKNPGRYDVNIDLLTLTASPFGKVSVPINASNTVAVVNLLQDCTVDFPYILDIFAWDLDFDFFKLEEDNTITFKPINGLYRLEANFEKNFIRVDMMKNKTDYAEMDLEHPNQSALFAIGDAIGKPTKADGFSWNTTAGAWCLAQHEPNVYQITFIAGAGCNTTGINWKPFEGRNWNGAFEYDSVSPDSLVVVRADGNLGSGTKPLEAGAGYTYKFDLSKGAKHVELTVEKADIPVSGLSIKVNGAAAQKLTATHYKVPAASFTQGSIPVVEGVDDFLTWYLDPDYIGSDFTFLAVSGYYSVDIFLDHKFCLFKRVSASGVPLTSSDGAIWLMAWGLAAHTMDGVQTEGGQLAFTPGTSYCMAEYAPGKYRFSGIAVEEKDGTTIGGRFRYDYLSIKYFGQDGWGNEKGKIFGATTTVQYTERCKDIIGGDGSDNISLLTHKETVGGEEKDIPDHPLDLGATYVLELDLTTPGIELIDFYKK